MSNNGQPRGFLTRLARVAIVAAFTWALIGPGVSAAYGQRYDPNNSALAAARGQVRAAQSELDAVVRAKRATFEADVNVRSVRQRLEASIEELATARATVEARLLEQDPDYREMVQTVEQLQGQLDTDRPTDGAAPPTTRPGAGGTDDEAIPATWDEQAYLDRALAEAADAARAAPRTSTVAANIRGATDDNAPRPQAPVPSRPPPTTRPAAGNGAQGATSGGDQGGAPTAAASPERVAQAERLLGLQTRIKEKQDAATSADPAATRVLSAYEQAAAQHEQMRAQFRANLLNDPQYVAVRQRLEAARADLGAAGGY